MKKINQIVVLSLLASVAITANAQEKGKVIISTIYDQPEKNIWNVGIALLGVDVQNQASGGIYYMVHGRFTMGKLFTFSANAAMDLTKLAGTGSFIKGGDGTSNINPFSHFEGRASFHFSDKEGSLKNTVKLGQGIENRGGANYTVKYSTQYSSKVRNIYGITASLNLHNHVGIQVDDSASDKRSLTLADANGKDVGFKKMAAINQKNMILGVGLFTGQYTHYKGKFTGGAGGTTKTRRIKKSISASIEMLLGLSMNMGDKAYWKDENNVIREYAITDAKKKRIGWRITADYGKNKIGFFQHFELGMRPGLFAPNRQSKILNQGYLNWGLGFGF